MSSNDNKEKQSDRNFTRVAISLWRLFSSVRLAIILILVITILSLIGAFIATPDFFHSWWFLAPGVLLMLNILICTLNRWKSIKRIIKGGQIKQPESFFVSRDDRTENMDLRLSPTEASATVEKVLHKQGYRIRTESESGRDYLAVDKNRYYKLGTFASHLSLILFVLAYIIGGATGFRDTSFTITEGETREVGHNTGLSLNLTSFADEYYADNTPKDYRSQVVLFENGMEVTQALIRVNHPLIYKGIRFYQAFFGSAVRILLKQNGEIVFHGNIVLTYSLTSGNYQRDYGYLDFAESGLSIRFISSATNLPDTIIPKGQLAVDIRQNGTQIALKLLEKEIPLEIAGIEFTYQEDSQFSGFQVSRDPGNLLIWIASSLFIIGVILVLYFPHRQLWILIQPLSPEQSRMFIRLMTPRGFSNTAELKKLIGAIKKELPANCTLENGGGLHGQS